MGLNQSGAERAPTIDHEAIGALGDVCSEAGEHGRGGLDAVRLLDAKLSGTGDFSAARGHSGGDGDDGKLINESWDLAAADGGAVELGPTNDEIAHRLSADDRGILDGDVRAHAPQHVDDAGPGRVESDATKQHLRARQNGRSNKEERCGGNVAGHIHVPRVQALTALKRAGHALAVEGGSHGGEHALGVVSRQPGLDDGLGALPLESGEQQGRLDLCAGVGGCEALVDQTAAANGQRCESPALPTIDLSAHGPKRITDPGHRTPPEGVIAGENRHHRLTGQHTCQQTHGGARVAAIQDIGGLKQGQITTGDEDRVVLAGDLHTHRSHAASRGAHIIGVQQTPNAGPTRRQTVEHEGTVGQRLVAGNSQLTAKRARG